MNREDRAQRRFDVHGLKLLVEADSFRSSKDPRIQQWIIESRTYLLFAYLMQIKDESTISQ